MRNLLLSNSIETAQLRQQTALYHTNLSRESSIISYTNHFIKHCDTLAGNGKFTSD